jgi:hypothetical protein
MVKYLHLNLSTGEPGSTSAELMPSHMPTLMSGFTDRMTFIERAKNLAVHSFFKVFFMNHYRLFDGFIQKYLPNSPGSTELLGNLSGCLINANFAIDYPRLLPTSFFNIAGFQINREIHDIKDQVPNTFMCLSVAYLMQVTLIIGREEIFE